MLGNLWKSNKSALFAGVVCLLVFFVLIFHIIDQHRFIRSNDALVQGHFTTIGTRASGVISKVYVDENDVVKKDQILAEIDSKDYLNKLRRARAEHEAALTQVKVAEQDFVRAAYLFKRNDISAAVFDHAKSDYLQKKKLVERELAGTETAEINRDYTLIRAPAEGIIALRGTSVGDEVQVGDSLFGIVYPQEKWIEAKIKETDLGDLKIGEKVQVKIDALPGQTFQGKLISISPTSEGLDAPIPPDNSAGNFTKYVQRVAVKIALVPNEDEDEDRKANERRHENGDQDAVRIGLSADIRISRSDRDSNRSRQ
jgi:membrane fusion protein (multidrug efflux system)